MANGKLRHTGARRFSRQDGHNVAMPSRRALLDHPISAQMLRYGVAGVAVATLYLGLPVVLKGVFDVPIQVAIPIAYVLAITLHFNLQRHFVFRHVATFALTTREQIARYVVAGAFQYPATAIATALLPELLGLSEQATFVCTTLAISLTFFIILRTHVFHPTKPIEIGMGSAAEPNVAEADHRSRSTAVAE